jgi:hypothetical protein
MDARGNLLPMAALDQGDIVPGLPIEPELRPATEVAREAHCYVGGERAAPFRMPVIRPEDSLLLFDRMAHLRTNGQVGQRLSGVGDLV